MRPERFNAIEEAINAKNAKILLIERTSLLNWSLVKNILKFLSLRHDRGGVNQKFRRRFNYKRSF